MHVPTRAAALCAVLALATAGCDLQRSAVEPLRPGAIRTSIVDATRPGGTPGFYWLAPISRGSGAQGTFDPMLLSRLAVDVCAWNGSACTAPAERFDATGSGPARLRVESGAEPGYRVNWKTSRELDPASVYRIRVLLDSSEIGHADVRVAANGRALKNVDPAEFVAVVAGQTLPIHFWIATGTTAPPLGGVGPGGGTVTLASGAVVLGFAPGAVDQQTEITAVPAASYPQGGGTTVVPGSVYDFGPDGIEFDAPVLLTIRYDPAALPAGVEETELRLHHLENGTWRPVPGSSVNTTTHSVSGFVDGFSAYGAAVTVFGSTPVITVWGRGTASVDGALGTAEWAQAFRDTFTVYFPDGTSAQGHYYLMNDAANLYVAVRYPRSAADAETHVNMTSGTDQWVTSALAGSGTAYADAFLNAANTSCGSPCADRDVDYGGSSEGSGAFANDGTHTVVEMAHPLNSSDDAHDISTGEGEIVGFHISLLIGNGTAYASSQVPPASIGGRILITGTGEVLSGAGSATVDGSITPGEWTGSDCLTGTIDLPGGGSTAGELCVMNDATNLFYRLRFTPPAGLSSTTFYMNLDSGADASIDGDDKIATTVASGTTFEDRYWFQNRLGCPAGSACDNADVNLGGATNGAGAAGAAAGGEMVIEMSHPLDSGDAFDMSRTPGTVIRASAGVSLLSAAGLEVSFLNGGPLAHIYLR